MKNYVKLPPDGEKCLFGLFTRDKKFYRSFFSLLFVITLQQVAALAVNLADNIMLGRYSELALSGATLVNQVQFTLQQIAAGIGMGIVALGSQYWGKSQTQPIKKIIAVGMKFAVIFGIIFFAVSKFAPHFVLSLFTNDIDVINEGVKYLNIICWTYIIFAVSNALMYSLQSVETASVGTVMSLSTLCINMCLNYCLIFGNFGAPELGIRGAAIATLISRVVELVIIFVYVLCIDKKLKMKFRDFLGLDISYLKDYIKVSSPLVISGMMWGVAQAAQTSILGHMSATAIAANSIATVIFQICAVVGMSAANASSVIMGKTVGEGKFNMVRPYTKTMQMLFLFFGLSAGALMFIFKDLIVGFYAVEPETKRLAINFLIILSITTVGSCYEYPIMGGIIAGGGETKFPAIIDNVFMWGFTIPVSFLSAFVFKFSPEITFCCLKADQILKCITNGIVCNRYRWVKVLTR